MLFNSINFLIFFSVATVIYFLLPHKWRWLHLLAASCFFYASFVPKYLLIIFFLIGFNYFCGIYIERSSGRKRKVMVAIAAGITILTLLIFKYYYFFVADFDSLLAAKGYSKFSLPLILLFPIGLSFQAFQLLSYIFEINKGTINAERHFGIFSLYVMFYPKLVAGPIERPGALLPQFREVKSFDADRLIIGLKIMLWGFFKKIVIADRLATYVSEVYSQPENAGSLNIWLCVAIVFPFQLYCDFSGYSSIAVGAAKIMGFDLTENFNKPFNSLTFSEFWTRWHISLSSWLRDYVYMPIVISLRKYRKWSVVSAIMVTFFISGVWHGAGWAFVVYGLVQGLIFTIEYLLKIKPSKLSDSLWKSAAGIVSTIFLWSLSLIFFRAVDLNEALFIIKKMFWKMDFRFTPSHDIPGLTYGLCLLLIIFLLYFENKKLDAFIQGRTTVKNEIVVTSCLLAVMIIFGIFHNLSFIYAQF